MNNAGSERGKLLARIQRRYQTITDTIELCGHRYAFTRIADPNRILADIAAEEDRQEKVSGLRKGGDYLHLPYWAELWDSALGMSQLLIKRYQGTNPISPCHPFTLSPCQVLDLGCGMGLTGTVAASLGLSVVFADLEPAPLLFAKLNSLPYLPSARTYEVDWRTARLSQRFHTILGADILYERKQWDELESFWRHHLAAGGNVLLGEPGRVTGDHFPTWIAEHGWSIERHQELIATRSTPIRLFEIRLQ